MTDDLMIPVRGLLAGDWVSRKRDPWCYLEPNGHQRRSQGWKLHVSATSQNAAEVLRRAVGVLGPRRCAFKFADSPGRVAELVDRNAVRSSSGKFITVYPLDDEQFRAVAAELHEATEGLAGPQILSDRRYRPGSLVHYRYGAFTRIAVLDNDGSYRYMITAPDGSLVEDRRDAAFTPPPWADAPWPQQPQPSAAKVTSRQVLLADRFLVQRAIRHANKGGVYRAVDQRTGAAVVVKQARPHVGSSRAGDVRDQLRHEADVLRSLEPLAVAPRVVELLELDEHCFLVQEELSGLPFGGWISEIRCRQGGLTAADARTMAGNLVRLLSQVHAQGLVLCDLSPNNIMVAPDLGTKVIDLELAAHLGVERGVHGTPGFVAPERRAPSEGRPGTGAEFTADTYALGALLYHLVVGYPPILAAELPPRPDRLARLAPRLARAAQDFEAARRLRPLVLGLMADDPAERWTLEQADEFLARPTAERDAPEAPRTGPSGRERMAADILTHLLDTRTPRSTERLWPSGGFGVSTEPCNVQHGAGGIVAVLVRALDRADGDLARRLTEAVADSSAWMEDRLAAEPRVLPGLYFGRSGTLWALHEAARALGDGGLAERARERALALPVRWPNPDVCHGAAGAGLAQLYFWQASGDLRFADRVRDCAEGLVDAADEHGSGVLWRIPADFDSKMAGLTQYGFAHGAAGIGTFLVAAGRALDEPRYLATAARAAETLHTAALRRDGAARWSTGPGDEKGLAHWCNGSSGVGTFLVRLWDATGEQRHLDLARSAAAAVYADRLGSSPAACHGLAGDAEFLLDLADRLPEADPGARYRALAEEFAETIAESAARRNGLLLPPDETGMGLTPDYGTGAAGVLALLQRLADDRPRLWLPETGTPLAVGRRSGAGARSGAVR